LGQRNGKSSNKSFNLSRLLSRLRACARTAPMYASQVKPMLGGRGYAALGYYLIAYNMELNMRFLLLLFLLLIFNFSSFCQIGISDSNYNSKSIALAKEFNTNEKIIYPSEKQFLDIIDWLNIGIQEKKIKLESYDGKFELNEFSNYKYGYSDHSYVIFKNNNMEQSIHMKIYVVDILNNDHKEIIIFENAGSLKIDHLLGMFEIDSGTINQISILNEYELINNKLTNLQDPAFVIVNGIVRMKFDYYEAWDKDGKSVSPYSFYAKTYLQIKTDVEIINGKINYYISNNR